MSNRLLETRCNDLPIRDEVVIFFESCHKIPICGEEALWIAEKVAPGVMISGSTARYSALEALDIARYSSFPPSSDLDIITLRDGSVVKGKRPGHVGSDIRHVVNFTDLERYIRASTCTGLDQIFLGRLSPYDYPHAFLTDLAMEHIRNRVIKLNPALKDTTTNPGLLRPASVFRPLLQYLRLKDFGFKLQVPRDLMIESLRSGWNNPRTQGELKSALYKAHFSGVEFEFINMLRNFGFTIPNGLE